MRQFQRRILIVEDDAFYRSLVSLLAAPLAEVVAVATPAEALDELRTAPIDAILSDTELGAGVPSGLELLAEVESRWPTVRRYLMSSSPRETKEVFFRKPITMEMIELILREEQRPRTA